VKFLSGCTVGGFSKRALLRDEGDEEYMIFWTVIPCSSAEWRSSTELHGVATKKIPLFTV
jgi:hypothetical protein